MIQRNKGDTPRIGIQINLEVEQAARYKDALIRILSQIPVQESDQVQLNDIKEVFKLLDYFSESKNTS
jgi:sulfur relay (sulfurtransferase) DsrF/TusC family protein